MKKLIAVVVVAIFSLSCMAGLFHEGHSWQQRNCTISINNQSGVDVVVTDMDNNKITVLAGQSGSMRIILHEPKSGLLRGMQTKGTTITVAETGSNGNSEKIFIEENIHTVTVAPGLQLSAN